MARRKLRGITFDSPDEVERFHAKESWVPLVVGAIPIILVGIVCLVVAWAVAERAALGWILFGVSIAVALLTRIPGIISNLDTDVIITDKRLYVRSGIIDIKDQACDLANVSDVTVDPSVFGRLFDYADVTVQTYAGESDFELRHIAHAYDMRSAISRGADSGRVGPRPAPREHDAGPRDRRRR